MLITFNFFAILIDSVPPHIHSWVSRVFFYWVNPFLNVGFSRPLQENGACPFVCPSCERYLRFHTDLWELPHHHLTAQLTEDLELNYYSRCPPENRPSFLREKLSKSVGSIPDLDPKEVSLDPENFSSDIDAPTNRTSKEPIYDSSVFKAIHRVFFRRIWLASILDLFAGMFNILV